MAVSRTRKHWIVLIAAFLGWLFDGFEMALFPAVARPALLDLLGGGEEMIVGAWYARITVCFLLGATAGGMVFGRLGDRCGRGRALSLSILTYSLFTGLSYFANAPWQLGMLRFLGAIGMGGEWSLGVALVMECWPGQWRPALAGAIGAAANGGYLLCGAVAHLFVVTQNSWRWMFLVGACAALLVLFILFFVSESEPWKHTARQKVANPAREVFSRQLLGRTLLATGLASVALIGTWGSVQWLPIWADQLTGGQVPEAKAETQIILGLGAMLGCFIAPWASIRAGRRPAYFLFCFSSLFLSSWLFRNVTGFGTVFLILSFLVSAATASFYGFFPLYFSELFPTRVRATGPGLSYNFGRLFGVRRTHAGAFGGGVRRQLCASGCGDNADLFGGHDHYLGGAGNPRPAAAGMTGRH